MRGAEEPAVFVDASGRRLSRVRIVLLVGVALMATLAGLLVWVSGVRW